MTNGVNAPAPPPGPAAPPKADWKKFLEENVAWSILVLCATIVAGTVAALIWLNGHIDERVTTSQAIRSWLDSRIDEQMKRSEALRIRIEEQIKVSEAFQARIDEQIRKSELLASRIETQLASSTALRERIEGSASVPRGGVVAFDLPEGCPAGWTLKDELAGRFIIGAGTGVDLTARKYRDRGGLERAVISPSSLPRHNHDAGTLTALRSDDFLHFSTAKPSTPESYLPSSWRMVLAGANINAGGHNHRIEGQTGFAGLERPIPHEHMPPFLALYLCQRK